MKQNLFLQKALYPFVHPHILDLPPPLVYMAAGMLETGEGGQGGVFMPLPLISAPPLVLAPLDPGYK